MLHIERFEVNMIQENCYIIHDESNEAVIIDDGAHYKEEQDAIENYIKNNHLKPVLLLNTHTHFDHIMGNKALYDTFGLKARFSSADSYLYDSISEQMKEIMGCSLHNVSDAPAGDFIKEGDELVFGNNIKIVVISTPGHTPGGLCFYLPEEKVLFSGDSLFQGSIGRTDFPGGNEYDLINSLKEKVLTLPGDVTVLPGHGPSTTIEAENYQNIYFR